MTTNDVILLNQLLAQRRAELAPDMSEADFFQIFAAEQALKDRDLSYDELQNGIVDGGGDGGIDAVYLFVNNLLYREEIDPKDVKRNVLIELVFVQTKTATGFSESGVERFISSARDMLTLSKDLSTFTAVYKTDLLGKMNEFRSTYLSLTSKFPQLTIRYYSAALATEVHPNVQRKVEPLRETIQTLFSPVEFSCEFLRAQDLLALARRAPRSAHHLKLAENPISTGQQGFVCLVGLNDFCDFICAEDGSLR